MRGAAFFHVVLKHGRTTNGRTDERTALRQGARAAEPCRAYRLPPPFNANRAAGQSERAAGQRGRARPLLPRQLDARCSLRIWRRFCPRRDNVPPRESPASDDFIINPFQASTSIEAADRPGTVQIGPVRLPGARACMLSSRVIDSSSSEAEAAESAAAARLLISLLLRSVGRCHGGGDGGGGGAKILLFMGLQNCTHWSVGRLVAWPQFPIAKI